MKRFVAFVVLSSLLTIAVVALAHATVLNQAPAPEQPFHLTVLPKSLV